MLKRPKCKFMKEVTEYHGPDQFSSRPLDNVTSQSNVLNPSTSLNHDHFWGW